MKLKTSKKIVSLLIVAMLGISVAACSNKEDKAADKPKEEKTQQTESKDEKNVTTKDEYTYDNNEYLTSIAWLEKNMKDNKNLVIIDARSDKDYAKGHIPGAVNVAWQGLSKMEGKAGDKDWGTLQGEEDLSKSLGALGISKDSQVVVYANKDAWGEDGRVTWSLKRAGVDARMLNGGFDLWSSEKKETTKDVPEVKPAEMTVSEIKPDMNISTDDLKKEYKDLKVIDARAKDEYEGAVNFGEARGGHLPDAINVPFTELYNEDGTLKNKDEIVKIMEKAGVKKEDSIATYCTAGIRSAHMALALKNAGFENVRNYDSSFYEWAADESNEVVK
jgi:thiosulfate/3-mercaptopyruvate sulfurtransferase